MPALVRPTHYRAMISSATLARFPQGVRIWDTPASSMEGARVLAVITTPTAVEVLAEQYEPYSDRPERARIRYGDTEGWVLSLMLTPLL